MSISIDLLLLCSVLCSSFEAFAIVLRLLGLYGDFCICDVTFVLWHLLSCFSVAEFDRKEERGGDQQQKTRVRN